MPTLEEVRQKYPQYGDLSDADLLKGIHGKFYSDVPFEKFSALFQPAPGIFAGLRRAIPPVTTTPSEIDRLALESTGQVPEVPVTGGLRPVPAPSPPRAATGPAFPHMPPVEQPPLIPPPLVGERPEQPGTEAELRRAGSVMVPRRTFTQEITEAKPGTAIAAGWAELPEMKLAQALGAAGVDVATKEQLAEDLGANPTILDKTLRAATGIVGSPLSMAAFAWGALGVPVKAVQASLGRILGPKAATEGMARIVAASAETGQRFATFEAVSNASQQLARWKETGEVPSAPEFAKAVGRGAVLGAAMGPAARVPGTIARTAAETAALTTTAAGLEGRLPTLDDLIETGAILTALKLTNLPANVSKALSTPSASRTPVDRAIVDQIKRGLEPIRRPPIGVPQAREEAALAQPPAEVAPPSGVPALEPPQPRVAVGGEGYTPLTPEVVRQVTDAITAGLQEVSGMRAPVPRGPTVQEPAAPRTWPMTRVVQAPDGSMVRVTVRADGQSTWQEMTNPRSKRRAAAEGAITQVTGDEFLELMGRKRGLAPEEVTGIRQQFLQDESLMPPERGGAPPEPAPQVEPAPPPIEAKSPGATTIAPEAPPATPMAPPQERPVPALPAPQPEPIPAARETAAPTIEPTGVAERPTFPVFPSGQRVEIDTAKGKVAGTVEGMTAGTLEDPEGMQRVNVRADNGAYYRGADPRNVHRTGERPTGFVQPRGPRIEGAEAVIAEAARAVTPPVEGVTPSREAGAAAEPARAGTALSAEELARTETFYRAKANGEITYLGKQPDATLKPREAIIAVDPSGNLRVQESLKAGSDNDVLAKFGKKVKAAVTATEKPAAGAPVGLDSTLRDHILRVGGADKDVLREMEDSAKASLGAEGGKVFHDVSGEFVDREGPRVVGFKTGKPEWMQVEGKPGEYYTAPEVLKVLEKLQAGSWPKTARQERIANQVLDAIRFDANQEKARLAGYGAEATTSTEPTAREKAIEEAFFREVDRLAGEEARTAPAEGARAVKTQPEMFTGRETIGPAITPEKIRPAVPQVAAGDELLAGMRPPEAEPQLSIGAGGFTKDQRVIYTPKPYQPSIRGRILTVNADGTVDFRADAGGTVKSIPAEGGRLAPEGRGITGRRGGGASAMAAVNVAAAPERRPPGARPPGFRQRVVEARAQPGPTALSQAAKAVGEARDDIRRVLNPASRSEQARQASFVLRQHLSGDLAQRTDRARAALNKARTFFASQDAGPNMAWFDRAERGEAQPSPVLSGFNTTVRDILDGRRKDVQALGENKLQTFYENYMPHIYAEPEAAKRFFAEWFSKRPIEGGKAFLKERTIPTMLDAMFPEGPPAGWERMGEQDLRKAIHAQGGLEPASYNPVDLVLRRTREMDRFITAHHAISELESLGPAFLKYKPVFEEMPEGYTRINDSAFRAYGKPTITVKEAYDKQVVEKLQQVLADLGVRHERKPKIGGSRWGYAIEGAKRITTKFAGPESVIMHELGHELDFRYDLWRRLVGEVEATGKRGEVTKGASQAERVTIKKELRALADLRYEGSEPEKAFREYVRRKEEQIANAFMAFLYAPDRMGKVAPKVKARLEAFLGSRPELKPILGIKPSLVLGEGATEIPTGGLLLHGEWVAPEPVARLINNMLSPGLRERSGLFRGYLGLGNVLNQFQLGWSAFHLGFTTLDAATSKFALALYQAAHGKPGTAVGTALKTPIAPFTGIVQGDRILKEWYAPGSQPAEIAKIADGVRLAGGRAQMDRFYATNITQRMTDAFRAAMQPERSTASRVGKAVGGILRTPFALTEQAIRPVLEYIVPRQKLAVFADMYRFELERLGPEATKGEIREAAAKAWDSADNRMGQLVYDNLFWNKTVKDLAMASIRSVGWNLGTWREIGGGLRDLPQLAKGDLTFRASYLAAIPVITGLLGAVLQYTWTGKGPDELRDYFFPQTGGKDEQGRPERVSLPSYLKDIYHYWKEPFRTVANKVHPLMGFLGDMFQNRDYYGTKIRNEDDPAIQQMLDVAKHVATSFVPIAVRGLERQRERGEGVGSQIMPFIGLVQAPAAVVRSEAENRAFEYLRAKAPEGSRTKEQAARTQALAQVRREAGLGRSPIEKGREVVQSGVATSRDVLRAIRGAKESSLQRAMPQLSAGEALNVYEVATEEERRKIRAMVSAKVKAARSKPQEWTEAVENRARALGFLPQNAPGIFDRLRRSQPSPAGSP